MVILQLHISLASHCFTLYPFNVANSRTIFYSIFKRWMARIFSLIPFRNYHTLLMVFISYNQICFLTFSLSFWFTSMQCINSLQMLPTILAFPFWFLHPHSQCTWAHACNIRVYMCDPLTQSSYRAWILSPHAYTLTYSLYWRYLVAKRWEGLKRLMCVFVCADGVMVYCRFIPPHMTQQCINMLAFVHSNCNIYTYGMVWFSQL